MTLRFSYVTAVIVIVTLGSSCASRKKLIYFQGDEVITDSVNFTYTPTYEVGDILSIVVSGTDPKISAPFNQIELASQGSAQYTSYGNGIAANSGYLIGADSTISMPIIGKIKIGGLEQALAVDTIQKILVNYLDNPQVSIRILNFKITVLGDVKVPGTYAVPNERITILEALGIANDLKITGQRSNVLVVRHENGKKTEYRIDLTSKDVFSSPVYYLKQNDLVYVEPNNKARFDSSIFKSSSGIFISVASLIITTIVLINK